jgi:hypothetical protein
MHLVIETKCDVISLKNEIKNTPFDMPKARLNALWEAISLSPKQRLVRFERYLVEKLRVFYSGWSPHSEFWFFGNRQLENRSCLKFARRSSQKL